MSVFGYLNHLSAFNSTSTSSIIVSSDVLFTDYKEKDHIADNTAALLRPVRKEFVALVNTNE